MRIEPPALLPVLRSRAQAELLTWLYLHPDLEYGLGELATRLQTPPSTLHAEVERLVTAGLLTDRHIGRNRLLRVNLASRYSAALSELLLLAFGPRTVVGEEFATIPGAEAVIIYGSWAGRAAGVPGREPADIDVLVVGHPEREQLYAAADRAQERLGIPVNPVVRSRAAWDRAEDPLVVAIASGPHVTIGESCA